MKIRVIFLNDVIIFSDSYKVHLKRCNYFQQIKGMQHEVECKEIWNFRETGQICRIHSISRFLHILTKYRMCKVGQHCDIRTKSDSFVGIPQFFRRFTTDFRKILKNINNNQTNETEMGFSIVSIWFWDSIQKRKIAMMQMPCKGTCTQLLRRISVQ